MDAITRGQGIERAKYGCYIQKKNQATDLIFVLPQVLQKEAFLGVFTPYVWRDYGKASFMPGCFYA